MGVGAMRPGHVQISSFPLALEVHAPATVGFLFLCVAVLVGHQLGVADAHLKLGLLPMHMMRLPDLPRFVAYPLAHTSWSHLASNFATLLLLAPGLEARYGSLPLVGIFCGTAAASGMVYSMFASNSMLVGSSGIVFACILLSGGSRLQRVRGVWRVPVSYAALVGLWTAQELAVMLSSGSSRVSHFCHFLGGLCGLGFAVAWSPSPPMRR